MFRTSTILTLTFLMSAWSPSMAQQPLPVLVSPGGADQVLAVAQSCPTFSWGAEAKARSHELMVFDLADLDHGEGEAEPVLRVQLPGSVHSWTPSLDRCLDSDTRYAWFVLAAGADGEQRLSEGRFFEVRQVPSADELTAALEMLDRYLNQAGPAEANVPPELAAAVTDRGPWRRGTPTKDETLSKREAPARAKANPAPITLSGVTGIRAEVPDPAGTTFGVLGVSNSASGAGLAAENTANGPDLVLAGSQASLAMTESGIDIASTSSRTFDVGNSGGGSLFLTVNGALVATTDNDGAGSGFNADLLDGHEEAAFFRLGQNETVTGRPAFNGGTSGANAPFTVDSTSLVANLNADRLDNLQGTSLVRSDSSDNYTFGTLTFDVGTRLRMPAASATTPFLHFANDTQTGLYSPGQGQFAVSTNGQQSMRIDAGGSLYLRNSLFLEDQTNESMGYNFIQDRFQFTDGISFAGPLMAGTNVGTAVAYHRIGSATTAGALDGLDDLLVSGDLEVNGTVHYGCGAYQLATFCPAGNTNTGPKCDQVPAGSFCESDGECMLADANNCGSSEWWFKQTE